MRLGEGRAWLALPALFAACGTPSMRPSVEHGPVQMPDLDAPAECGPYSVDALMKCVEPARIESDVRLLAHPRPPASEQHQKVRELCAERLSSFGLEVSRHDYGSGTNVVAVKPGFTKTSQQVIVSAHYDHLPSCPGADDNATGVAAVLETARVLSQARFDRTLVVACWDEGERGQLGSQAYAERASRDDRRIEAAFSYEAIGFFSREPESQQIPDRFEELFPDQALDMLDNDYRGDFIAVVTDTGAERWALALARHGEELELPVQILTLTEATKARQKKLHRSDHSSFWDAGYPALLVTDTGPFRNPHHHCKEGADVPDTLDFELTALAARAALGAVVEALELR